MTYLIYAGVVIAVIVVLVLIYRYVTSPRDYWFEELTDDILDLLD